MNMPAPPRRRFWPWAVLALVAVPLLAAAGLAAALWLAVEPLPRVPVAATAVSVDDIERAKRLLERNDPRHALPGITRAVQLSQRDLELIIRQAGQRLGSNARGRVRLQPGLAVVEASVPLPARSWTAAGQWLNLRAVLRESDDLPRVQQLQLGNLPVPGWLAEAALPPVLAALNLRAQGELAHRLVSHVAFRSQSLVLAYAWPDNAQLALAETLLAPADQERLRRHADHLAVLATSLAGAERRPAQVPLGQLIQPMFTLAAARSHDAASAVQENRAALVALAFLAAGQPLGPLLGAPAVPAASAVTTPAHRPPRMPDMRLHGRPDWPLHLLISAALAAEGGGPLSDAIGLYKEVADSRHGSGFSFADLAADRAGTRLGLAARRDPLALQARLAQGPLTDASLLPNVHDLPEDMQEAEFKRRFGGVGAPAHQAMLQEIETRLDRLPLLALGR